MVAIKLLKTIKRGCFLATPVAAVGGLAYGPAYGLSPGTGLFVGLATTLAVALAIDEYLLASKKNTEK